MADSPTGSCCLCDNTYVNYGHNPWPLVPDDDDFSRCCDTCNTTKDCLLGCMLIENKRYQLAPNYSTNRN